MIALFSLASYIVSYCGLRLAGKLAVNAGGWHASPLRAGNDVLLPALALFLLFQPLLRGEAAVRRMAIRRALEPAVSEVVVEVVPMA